MTYLSDPFFVRNVSFGLEDSLISTTGVLVGIAAAGLHHKTIVKTGLILIFVEAICMAYGAFLAEENFLKTAKQKYTLQQLLFYALVMFLSYMVAGLIPLLPFVFGWPHAIPASMTLAMSSLFVMIWVFQQNLHKALTMTVIGTVIMTISVTLGAIVERHVKTHSD